MKNSLSILKYEIKENTIEVEVGFKNESEIVEVDKKEFDNWLWENGHVTMYDELIKPLLLEYILKPENK